MFSEVVRARGTILTDLEQAGASSPQQMVGTSHSVDLSSSHSAARTLAETVSPFAILATRLFFRPGAPRILALVSCKSREGVTTVSRSFEKFLSGQLATRVTLLPSVDCLIRVEKDSATTRPLGMGLVLSDTFLAAKHESDILLVDCASLESSPAVLVLAPHVDGVLLVVEDGRRSATEIHAALKLIKDANGLVLGLILNKRKKFSPKWLYSFFSRMR